MSDNIHFQRVETLDKIMYNNISCRSWHLLLDRNHVVVERLACSHDPESNGIWKLFLVGSLMVILSKMRFQTNSDPTQITRVGGTPYPWFGSPPRRRILNLQLGDLCCCSSSLGHSTCVSGLKSGDSQHKLYSTWKLYAQAGTKQRPHVLQCWKWLKTAGVRCHWMPQSQSCMQAAQGHGSFQWWPGDYVITRQHPKHLVAILKDITARS